MADQHHHHYHSPISVGMLIAALLSWVTHHSIVWAIIHGLLTWFYVIYWLFGGGR